MWNKQDHRFPIGLAISHLFIAMFAACLVLSSVASAAGPKLPPAPYKTLPVGTVLDYGNWKCTVEAGARHEQVCRGLDRDRVTFYGKFVPSGKLPKSGYATGLTGVWCGGAVLRDETEELFESVIIDQKARDAIGRLWPLRVGKEISFRRNFQPTDGKAHSTIRVVGTRTVTVAGVAQHVYVLKGETRNLKCIRDDQQPRGFDEVWWYNPALGATVHYEISWIGTETKPFLDFEYDLVKITVPDSLPPMASAIPAPVVQAPKAKARDRIADRDIPTVKVSPTPERKTVDRFAGIHFGRYHALVIGNNNYRHLPGLKMATGDAKAVADLLKAEYGFDVNLVTNATRADLIRALAKLRARLTANDNLLVYYAGHGVVDEIGQVGYWLPVDAEEGIPTNWVSTGDINVMLRAIRAKHVMVVADSCYSGTLVRAVNSRIRTAQDRMAWIKRMIDKRSRTALVSGGLEPVMDGGGRGHSVFARAFLNALRENSGVMEGQALFYTLRRLVVLNSDQTPQYSDIRKSGHEGGDFVFVRRGLK